MKPWRDILALCVSIVVMLAVASCSGHSDRPGLVALDSLILQDPDSACELLAAYPTDSLPTADDRAYHALLTTIADYKAYRPATTDSVINIALNHYDHNGANQDHRMRSLLYKGCVMEELGDPKEAMRCYKEAQYTCPDGDHFHLGYIHYRIAILYQHIEETTQTIANYRKAYLEFSKTDNIFYKLQCSKYLGAIYRLTQLDSAFVYINKTINEAKRYNNQEVLYESYSDLAGYHFLKKDYKQALQLSLKVIQQDKDYVYDNVAFFYACQSYLAQGNIDSAQYIHTITPQPSTLADSMQYYRCEADILQKSGKQDLAVKQLNLADSLDDELSLHSLNNGLVAVEKDMEIKHDREISQKHITIFIVILLGALLAIIYFIYKSRKNKLFVADLENQVKELNKQIISSLNEIELLKQRGDKKQEVEQRLSSLDTSLECFSDIMTSLLKHYKTTSTQKSKKIHEMFDDGFFTRLHHYINMRYDNLVEKLHNEKYKLSLEEINIICLELCKFPNAILWAYSNCDRPRSIHTKKKIIADKVNHSKSIAEIPQNIL